MSVYNEEGTCLSTSYVPCHVISKESFQGFSHLKSGSWKMIWSLVSGFCAFPCSRHWWPVCSSGADNPQSPALFENWPQPRRSAAPTSGLHLMTRQTMLGYKSLYPFTPTWDHSARPPQLQWGYLWDRLWPLLWLCWSLIFPLSSSDASLSPPCVLLHETLPAY